jgi:hypothetical protein
MKKITLFLFLLFCVTLQAQIPSSFPPYLVCDDNDDGIATFDLNSQIPTILSGMDPATTTVNFYEDVTDAQTNANPITSTPYVNIMPTNQTIYIRVMDTTSSEVYYSSILLKVEARPNVTPGQLTFCDPTMIFIYNLTAAASQLTQNSGVTVNYYHTQADAENDINAIIDESSYHTTVNPGIEILFARVTNATGCFSVTTLTLNTNNCGSFTCPTPYNLTATNFTDTSFALGFTDFGVTAFHTAYIVPLGTPPTDTGFIITGPSPFVITGLSPNTCYSVYVKTACNPNTSSNWSAPLNICLSDCTNTGQCAEAFVLNAFFDNNNNGVKDGGEADFNYGNFVYQVNDSKNNQYGNSNSGNYYIFDANPTNLYDIHFDVNSNFTGYYSCTTSYSNITLPDGSGSNFLSFPVTVLQNYTDAKIILYPIGQPRPGFVHSVAVNYVNNGSVTIPNGTITFTKDPLVTITNISQTGTVATPTGFTYDFTNLQPGEFRSFYVTMQVPTIPTVNLGDILTSTASLEPIIGDVVPSDNNASLAQMVAGSYDPNDKSESHGGKIGLDMFTNNDYLYYTIQFENTGTASAEFIRIEDVLDSNLDETTFEMIRASHTVNTARDGNQLTWHFYNINLPPTVSQPTQSHGYVYFRIKPKAGYAVGDIIPNSAAIYFDYNPPIVTNTFNTEFFETLGNSNFTATEFQLYPNPASTNVHIIQNNNENLESIRFYDVSGKTIKQIGNMAPTEVNVDISALAKGVYFVEITTENKLKQIKKLIIQ